MLESAYTMTSAPEVFTDTPIASFNIRPASFADLDAIVVLEKQVFQHDMTSRAQYRHYIKSQSVGMYVATIDTILVGSLVIFFRRGSTVSRLYSGAVAPEVRAKGVAWLMFDFIERVSREHHCTRLRLEVRVDNDRAIVLYEMFGFKRIGKHHSYYEDGVDALVYEKEIV